MGSLSTDSAASLPNPSTGGLGDTRSIVSALQSLQNKIRRLEADRNFHQDQAEQAHVAHEAYKREVELRLERERQDHRRREDELMEMVSKVTAEKAQLKAALESNTVDVHTFRSELEVRLEHERRRSRERESSLRKELMEYRRQASEEQRRVQQLSDSVEHLRVEQDAANFSRDRTEGRSKNTTSKRKSSPHRSKPLHNDPSIPPRKNLGVVGNRSISAHRYQAPTRSSAARRRRGNEASNPICSERQCSPLQNRSFRNSGEVLAKLYAEISEELGTLRAVYDDTVAASSAGVTAESVHQLLGKISEKSEQLTLIQKLQRDLARSARGHEDSLDGSYTAKKNRDVTQQLRSLLGALRR